MANDFDLLPKLLRRCYYEKSGEPREAESQEAAIGLRGSRGAGWSERALLGQGTDFTVEGARSGSP